jgi:hypothetical protein
MKFGLSHRDSVICKHGHGCSPDQGMDEPSPGCDPPGALSPWDQGLRGDIPGDLVDSGLEESRAAS